jgi:hypothetical protein
MSRWYGRHDMVMALVGMMGDEGELLDDGGLRDDAGFRDNGGLRYDSGFRDGNGLLATSCNMIMVLNKCTLFGLPQTWNVSFVSRLWRRSTGRFPRGTPHVPYFTLSINENLENGI